MSDNKIVIDERALLAGLAAYLLFFAYRISRIGKVEGG